MAEMRPGDVPAEYVEAAADTIHAHYAANPHDESEETAIRILLAAVLPLHEQQMRAELEQLQSARPSICDYCGMDRRVHDSRTWMAHCEATAAAHPDALKQMRARRTDASGWTATENAEFEELYGVRAAMYLRAANDRVWEVVKELRNAAVADGRNPYEDPMAQRLAGALIGEQKAADGG